MKIKNVHGAPLLLAAVSALLIVFSFVDTSFLSVDGNAYMSSAVLQVLIFAIPSAIWARARGRSFTAHLRLRIFKAVDIPLLIYALGFMIFGGAAISFFLYRIAPGLFKTAGVMLMSEGVSTVGAGIYAVVSVALLPAVTEEFLFRGIIMLEYERSGVALAAVLSSLTFSLIHFDLIKLPVYFFLGLVLAMVTYATRSLFAAMIVHAANNVLAMFFERYVYNAAMRQGGGIVMFAFICIAAALLFAFLFFGALSRAYSDLSRIGAPSDHTKRKKQGKFPYVREALTSPAFLLLLAVSAAGIILNL
ncbi:MAG: CPBP family intramembrane metalloprotease [Clostridia bacterium]|nr:CPBP family intramembrane metalloprotease [Clostridia bacterium]